MKKRVWFIAVIAGVLAVLLAMTGPMYRLNNNLSDALFQREQALDGNVFVIGLDAKSLEELGPYQTWGRSYMAAAIEILNADEESRPAAIGIDVIYAGETDEYEDEALVEACAEYDNVVLAEAATFETALAEDDDGNYYMDDFTIETVDGPFPALAEVTRQGHINAMLDNDGIMRHGILKLDLPDGQEIYGFGYQLYSLFCEHHGIEADAAPPVNERYQWYVPFSGKPGAYNDGYSFSDLLTGELDTAIFADSVVLIGPYALGMMDYVTTPIDHSELMYGVEFQANVIDALIHGNFKHEMPPVPQYIALFIAVFASVVLFYRRSIKFSLLIWGVISVGYLLVSYLAYENGAVLYPLYIPISVTAVFVASVAANYIQAALEKKAITDTFKHYVAPEVVNELLKTPDALEVGGKLMDIAVLFVDIRGFTTLSEILTPPQVVEILNKYLTLTSSCIMDNHGTLDKFVGDATMAIFNAPLPQEDYIYKAVKAAWDMKEASKALSDELEKEFGRTVSFGIGVHCGPAVVGNIGAKMRMDYTAIGDTVNTAARLEANAPGGQILISRAVADALEGRIKVTSLGDSIRLKGKAAGFEILRVEDLI
ncbi:MAG: adenylate/guanylate cyclase domain-containing protein [Lachnospiraceae bacterium]|nr:adenylate/guanylate cyclase domain-containing protein [Lachnospiraceae bacterium]